MQINKNKFRNIQKIDEHLAFGELKLSEAEVSPNNIRYLQNKEITTADLDIIRKTLVPSIKALGLAQLPSCDSEGRVFIGSRRMKAYQEAGELWIPIVIKEIPRKMEKAQSWSENRARKEIDELTEAQYLKTKFIDEEKMTESELSRFLGVPEVYVKDRLKVLEALGGSLRPLESDRGLTREQEKKALTYEKARVLSRDWVPKKTREKFVKKIQEEGLGKEELQRELGKGKVIQTIMEQEENPEVKAKLEKEYGEEKAFEVEPEIVLEKQRELKGLAPTLGKIELPSEQFETDTEKIDVQINPKVMQRITKFFLDKKGRYTGCKVVIQGEIAKSEKE